jgi:hypothetical protein
MSNLYHPNENIPDLFTDNRQKKDCASSSASVDKPLHELCKNNKIK